MDYIQSPGDLAITELLSLCEHLLSQPLAVPNNAGNVMLGGELAGKLFGQIGSTVQAIPGPGSHARLPDEPKLAADHTQHR